MSSSASSIRVELYVQALDPSRNRQISDLLDRIQELESTGNITSWDVYVVGDKVCPETAFETDIGRHLCARFLQFREWANRGDKQLDPFFYPEKVKSEITGDEHDVITVPTVALAEFVDESLQFVTPCTDDETHYTPHKRLEAISSGEYDGTEQDPSGGSDGTEQKPPKA